MVLTPRERMRRTLNHELVDRPPVDLGSTVNTSIHRIAYGRLREYLGTDCSVPVEVMSKIFQAVKVEEDILERLEIDTRAVFPSPVSKENDPKDVIFVNSWGVEYRAVKSMDGDLLYYEPIKSPLADACSTSEIEKYTWPSPCLQDDELKNRAKCLKEETEFVLVGHPGDTSIFANSCRLRGMSNFLQDLILRERLAEAVLEHVLEVQCKRFEVYLQQVGEYLDVVAVGDDIAGQESLLISPELYRKRIKPYHKKYFEFIKARTDAALMLHSCGAIAPLLDDFIDMGVEIINPVQVSARGMDAEELKRCYGDQVVFWGGIDSQQILPNGSVREVKQEVLRRIRQFGKNGGYVVSAVHNIQPDVPPENVVALFEAATTGS